MPTLKEISESEVVIPIKTTPRVIVDDGLVDDHKRNRRRAIQNDVILAFLGLLGFSLIILVIGFS